MRPMLEALLLAILLASPVHMNPLSSQTTQVEIQQIPVQTKPAIVEQEAVDEPVDDKKKDPDWLPPDDDYYEDDYYDYYYEEEYDDNVDDDTSEDDPDWIEPSPVVDSNSIDDDNSVWNSDDDPDWLPPANYNSEEYYSDEDVLDYDYGDEDEDYSVEESVEDNNLDENQLWSSDEDPDWQPTQEYRNQLLEDIARLINTNQEVFSDNSRERTTYDDVLQMVKTLNLTLHDAELIRSQLEEIDQTVSSKETETKVEQVDNRRKRDTQSQVQQISQGVHQHYDDNFGSQIQQHYGHLQNQQQSSQIFPQYGQEQTGYIQQPSVSLAEVSQGVYPLGPYETVLEFEDVSNGVVPVNVDEKEEEDSSPIFSWIGRGWNRVTDVAESVGDRAQDTFSGLGDKISDHAENFWDAAQDQTSGVIDILHEAAHTTRDKVVSTYYRFQEKLKELKERMSVIFVKFGTAVQLGASYCLRRVAETADQIDDLEIMQKLETKLEEGNEQVVAFFALLGDKVMAVTHQQVDQEVDDGLTQVTNIDHQLDAFFQEGLDTPDLLQDKEVALELHKLVDSGVLTKEELQKLKPEHHAHHDYWRLYHREDINEQQLQQQHQEQQQQLQQHQEQQQQLQQHQEQQLQQQLQQHQEQQQQLQQHQEQQLQQQLQQQQQHQQNGRIRGKRMLRKLVDSLMAEG